MNPVYPVIRVRRGVEENDLVLAASSSFDSTRCAEQRSSRIRNLSPVSTSKLTARDVKQDKSEKITVTHQYHDHSGDEPYVTTTAKCTCAIGPSFPLKLSQTLLAVEKDGYDDVISWQPHGRCFVVHNPDRFKKEVLPYYFNLTKVSSFQRQLNLYGFKRLTVGNDRAGYYHELFLWGRVDLTLGIHRVKVKGTKIRGKSNAQDEPNFWNDYPWIRTDRNTETPVFERMCLVHKVDDKIADFEHYSSEPEEVVRTVTFDSVTVLPMVKGSVHRMPTEAENNSIGNVDSNEYDVSIRWIPVDSSSSRIDSLSDEVYECRTSFSSGRYDDINDSCCVYETTAGTNQQKIVLSSNSLENAADSIWDELSLLDEDDLECLKRRIFDLSDDEFFEW